MEKNKKTKKPYWLTRRLFGYLAVTVAAVMVFGVLLLRATTRLVEKRMVETNCTHLLDLNEKAYLKNLDNVTLGADTNTACDAQALRMLAARVEACAKVTDLPDWATMTRSDVSQYWLLGAGGSILRGGSLPRGLGTEEIKRLLRGNTRMIIGTDIYSSKATTLGVLVSKTPRDDEATAVYNTSLNNDTDSGFAFWVLPEGTVYGSPIAEMEGQPIDELCADAEGLRSAAGAVYQIGGVAYYCVTREMEDGSLLVAAIASSELRRMILNEAELSIILFAAAALAVLLYALIMHNERPTANAEWTPLPGGLYANRGLLGRLAAVAVGGATLLLGLSWLTMTLAAYAQQNLHAGHYLDDVDKSAPYYTGEAEAEFNNFRALCINVIDGLVTAIGQQESMAEPENLGRFADAVTIPQISFGGDVYNYTCQDARVYDKNGNMLATGKDILKGAMPGLSPEMMDYLKENSDYKLQYDGGNQRYFMAGQIVDGTGRYAIMMIEGCDDLQGWMDAIGDGVDSVADDEYNVAVTAGGLDMGLDGKAFVVRQTDAKTELIVPYTMGYGSYGDDVAMAEFDTETLRVGYAGEQIISGESYYINVAAYQLPNAQEAVGDAHYWLLYAMPTNRMVPDRAAVLLRVGGMGLGLLLLLAAFGAVRFSAPPAAPATSFTDRAARRTKTMNGHRVNGPIMGWGTKSGWGAKTPEEKYTTALGNLILVTIMASLVIGMSQGDNGIGTVIGYILRGKWNKDLNIFSYTYVVLVMVGCFSISWVVRGILGYITANLGPRSETMGKLFSSLVKYLAYIAAGMYLLYVFGVKMTMLAASAAVLTLVLSPALNALLGDVSAGVFIVFEDEYRVGDVVSIDGWRGVVLEISLRTTRLEDLMGNVKVFNNSQITSVENLSVEYTTSVINVNVPYEESIDHIENVLKDELPKIAAEVPNIIGTPTYEGIDEFGDSGVLIRVHIITREEHRFPATRRFRHELKAMFDRRGINIPYTQIVLHDAAAEAEAAKEKNMAGAK